MHNTKKYNNNQPLHLKKTNRKSKKNQKKIKSIILPNNTPKDVDFFSQQISRNVIQNENENENDIGKGVVPALFSPNVSSYAPTINKDLVSLKSIERQNVSDCNNNLAFELKAPLQIGISRKLFGETCVPYYDPLAIKFLLKNLSANKHVDPSKIVPPVQNMSNCWFNTMFVVLFVSDKGRKFFHFFRQLMIEGTQSNKKQIPPDIRNGLALLNYSIDACLTGNKYAYMLDTNSIIKTIYDAIPKNYKNKLAYITDINKAGNPIKYYGSLIYYLNNKSLQLLYISQISSRWKDMVLQEITKERHLPHCIVLELYDGSNKDPGMSGTVINKPRSFLIRGAKYSLDSCVIRDTTQQHFSANLTCENKEMAYDGMSYHRLVPMEWKKYINSDYSWQFKGSNNSDGSPLKWNFLHGYQMLIYYRVK
jgi:hypothetical protein